MDKLDFQKATEISSGLSLVRLSDGRYLKLYPDEATSFDETFYSSYNEDGERTVTLNELAALITVWREGKGFDSGTDNIPEKLMLMVTEVAEMMEEHRRGDLLPNQVYWEERKDDHPKPAGFAIEMADLIIRILDLSAALNIDIALAVAIKMDFNRTRPYKHGKTC